MSRSKHTSVRYAHTCQTRRLAAGAALLIAAAGFPAAAQVPFAPPAAALAPTASPATPATPGAGVTLRNGDPAVRAQDDFYRHVNGGWLQNTAIPADKARWGAFDELRENTLPQLRGLIDAAQAAPAAAGSEQQKIADLYASFIDQPRRDALGRTPLAGEFARIAALRDKAQLPALIAHFNRIGVTAPYDLGISQDGRDATRYAVLLVQSGLGLPDRDYYLKDDDARLHAARDQYQAMIASALMQDGESTGAAESNAAAIVALETALARVQWTKVENRDPVRTYNKTPLADLPKLVPFYDWNSWQDGTGIGARVDYVIVRQPSYFAGFAKVLEATPLATWQAYFRWHVLNRYAPYLSGADVARDFGFFGSILRGVPENEPSWQRGVRLVESGAGEILGRLYVEKYFPPLYKARMEKLVANLLEAYRRSIDQLDWMSATTKRQAQAKLASLVPKIGYPVRWRDYSALQIDRRDLVGNVQRIAVFNYERELVKLGRPIDRDEWGMTPQTVNAYYSPQKNEIVFPAAILQPPFFDPQADDAVNYGGIGAVIGHEISHGFDDRGSQFDASGNLRDWWTKEDHEKFAVKTSALVAQYGAYSPVPGYAVNGALTLGENIADNSGLAIAYKAYHLALDGKDGAVINGLSGDQRLYLGWAQVWRSKVRDAQQIVLIKTDPHAPGQFRGNGTLKNQPGFYSAFDVREGDGMYLAPAQRVSIW